ncbi:hypothetical protein E4U41_002888 [Claviceps citrina]|nr:hypothetical protein E4U41_002888 [Claviceps citrina]
MSLARGRPFVVPVTRLIKDCESWYRSTVGDSPDGPLVSMAVLRRDLDGLFSTIRSLCDSSQNPVGDGPLIAQSIQTSVERFFDQWHTEWGVSIGIGPPPPEVGRFCRTAGLSSALSIMRTAVQGESQVQYMPNNTAIMISSAACFALGALSSARTSGESALGRSIQTLVDEAAGVLERIGTVTIHRNGLSALHGWYLKQIARKAAAQDGHAQSLIPHDTTTGPQQAPARHRFDAAEAGHHHGTTAGAMSRTASENSSNSNGNGKDIHNESMSQRSLLQTEPLRLSTLSDDQMAHVLKNQPDYDLGPPFRRIGSPERMH